VRKTGRGSCSSLISSSSSHPTASLSPRCRPAPKSQRELSARSPVFCAFLVSLFLPPSLALPNLVVAFGCRPVVYPSWFLSSPGSLSSFPTHGPPLQSTSPKLRRLLQRHIASCLCPALIIVLSTSIGTKTGVAHRPVFATATASGSR
jgi:hypothetical protein